MLPGSKRHQCPVCQKVFERRDHLKRHFESHQNRRSFQCFVCGKAYNRRDLLLRHQTTHEESEPGNAEVQPRRLSRANQTCVSCASSKLKCDNERPCKRCRLSNRECTKKGYGPASFVELDPTTLGYASQTSPSIAASPNDDIAADDATEFRDPRGILAGLSGHENRAVHAIPEPRTSFSGPQNLDLTNTLQSLDDWSYPMYFENIIMSQDFNIDPEAPTREIPDVARYMQDDDIWSNTLDFSNTNNLDFFNANVFNFDTNPTPVPENTAFNAPSNAADFHPQIADSPASIVSQNSLRARFDAFRRSPWLWTPSLRQHAFSEQSNIAIQNTGISLTSPSAQPGEEEVVLQEKIGQATRDKILQLVIETSQSKVSIPAFPSHEVLDTLMKIGITKRVKTDSWLHLGTFRCGQSRPELLTALVAAGCVCVGVIEISKMGLLFQEIVRLSLDSLVEADNSVVRDLQYLQAYMLWIDIGISCGITRKMEIAESHFQPLCTALRRAGAFDRAMYHEIVPRLEDDSVTLSDKWHRWAKEESFRRLAYHTFEYDMRVATVFLRNPLTSFAEFTAPLPSSRALWEASSAQSWRSVFLSNTDNDVSQSAEVSLQDLICRPRLLETMLTGFEIPRAGSLLLHGLAGQLFEFRKNAKIAAAAGEQCSASLKLLLKMRQEHLYQDLSFLASSEKCNPSTVLFREFLLMLLYVDLDNVQRFAGKHGEGEARRAYAQLETWFVEEQSRNAVSHAGQVLRAGRSVPSYGLRGFEAIALYQATLVLWVYGVLKCTFVQPRPTRGKLRGAASSNSASDAEGLPLTSNNISEDDRQVFLDGPISAEVKRFIELGHGAPGLRLQRGIGVVVGESSQTGLDHFCDLRKSQMVMAVGVSVLESNVVSSAANEKSLPPLLQRLRDLMQELGALPGVQVV